jgi:hypothetical protein
MRWVAGVVAMTHILAGRSSVCLRGMFDPGTKPVCEREGRAAFTRVVVEPARCAPTVTLERASLAEAPP